MNLKILQTVICISLGQICFADTGADLDALETQDWMYHLDRRHYAPGYMTRLLKTRLPFGEFRKKKKDTPVNETKDLQNFLNKIVTENKETEKNHQSEALTIIDKTKNTVNNLITSSEKNYISYEGSIDKSMGDKFGLTDFLKCLKSHTSDLKMNILLNTQQIKKQNMEIKKAEENTSDQTSEVEKATKVQLSRKLDQTKKTPTGLVCGKSLGKADVTPLSMMETFKLVTALSARQENESKRVLQIFILARHSSVPLKTAGVWDLYWKIISLKAVFTTLPLPSIADLQNETLTILTGNKNNLSKEEENLLINQLSNATQEGEKIYEGLIL